MTRLGQHGPHVTGKAAPDRRGWPPSPVKCSWERAGGLSSNAEPQQRRSHRAPRKLQQQPHLQAGASHGFYSVKAFWPGQGSWRSSYQESSGPLPWPWRPGHPRTQAGARAGPATRPAPSAGPHAHKQAPLRKAGRDTGARGVPCECAHSSETLALTAAPGSGGCGGAGVSGSRRGAALLASSRALAHTPPGMVGSARVSRAPCLRPPGQVCGRNAGTAGRMGSGSRCCDGRSAEHSWAEGCGHLQPLYKACASVQEERGMTKASPGTAALGSDRAPGDVDSQGLPGTRPLPEACQLCHGVCVRYLRIKICGHPGRERDAPGHTAGRGSWRKPQSSALFHWPGFSL